MIYPLLPVFLAGVSWSERQLHRAIEGTAETTASLLKLLSGWWSDKVSTRKPFVWPAISWRRSCARSRPQRTARDRFCDSRHRPCGQGNPHFSRDALLADSAAQRAPRRAFGFHAAADNAGAVFGPLLAFFIHLRLHGVGALDTSGQPSSARRTRDEERILAVGIPAAIAMVVLIVVVARHPAPRRRQKRCSEPTRHESVTAVLPSSWRGMSRTTTIRTTMAIAAGIADSQNTFLIACSSRRKKVSARVEARPRREA